MSPKTAHHFPFLKLPAEMKNEIYGYVLQDAERGLTWDPEAKILRGRINPSILYTCKQIHNEAKGMVLFLNTIKFRGLYASNDIPSITPDATITVKPPYVVAKIQGHECQRPGPGRLAFDQLKSFLDKDRTRLSRLRSVKLTDAHLIISIGCYGRIVEEMSPFYNRLWAARPDLTIHHEILAGPVLHLDADALSAGPLPFLDFAEECYRLQVADSRFTAKVVGLEQWEAVATDKIKTASAREKWYLKIFRLELQYTGKYFHQNPCSMCKGSTTCECDFTEWLFDNNDDEDAEPAESDVGSTSSQAPSD